MPQVYGFVGAFDLMTKPNLLTNHLSFLAAIQSNIRIDRGQAPSINGQTAQVCLQCLELAGAGLLATGAAVWFGSTLPCNGVWVLQALIIRKGGSNFILEMFPKNQENHGLLPNEGGEGLAFGKFS